VHQQLGVLPRVLISRGDDEPPSRRQTQVLHDLRLSLNDVNNVQWNEEVRVGRVFTGP
jgi:hypothetical protein